MAVANITSNNSMGYEDETMPVATPKAKKSRKKSMESIEMKTLHGRLMDWYRQERDKQAENRRQMAIDEDFYDGNQWTEEDAQELVARGQAALVFNKIKPTINWLLGTERRTRIDGRVLPREESDDSRAEVKGKLLKYVNDVNHTVFCRSQAFGDAMKAGVGWMEDAISADPDEELLITNHVPWRDILHDSAGRHLDPSKDARYIFRQRYVDLDYAEALCPDRTNILKQASVKGDDLVNQEDDDTWYMGTRVSSTDIDSAGYTASRYTYSGISSVGAENYRPRVKLIEAWYRMPERVNMMRGGYFDGQVFNPNNQEMRDAYDSGDCFIVPNARMCMYVALMTEQHMLYHGKSPYIHNRYPFTPIWCYRRARDGLPYGVIRDIRAPQEDFNKRASKSLHILSSKQVIADVGSVEDIEDTRREVARPDGMIFKKKGTVFEINQDNQLAAQHLELMDRDAQYILDVGGVTEQNLGQDRKQLSGKAIGKLQDQGGVVTTHLFDNLRFSAQLQFEKQLSLIEQYYTQEKVIRIVGEAKPIEWIPINKRDPATGEVLNDITASKADYIIDEADFKASTREAMFEVLMDLLSKLNPDVALALLDMALDFADVPNKAEMIARVRKINGQRDPNTKPTPEEQAAMADKAQKEAEAAELQQDMLAAQVKEVLAKIEKTIADAAVSQAKSIETATQAAFQALQAAQIVATVPGITPIADAVLAGAGYIDQQGQDPNIPAPNVPPMEQGMMPPEQGMPPPEQMAPPPELMQADGIGQGIETPQSDSINPTLE